MIDKDIADITAAVKTLTGYRLIYRPNSDRHNLPAEYSLHHGPVCSRLKADTQRKCNIDCVQKVNRRAQGKDSIFLKRCHAGLLELVIPVFGTLGLEGCFLLGPMKRAGSKLAYRKLDAEYKQLPFYNKQAVNSAGKLLRLLSGFIGSAAGEIRAGKPEAEDKINKAINLVNAGIKTGIKAYEVAKACGVSQWYFLHLFKRKTGMSFTNYAKRMRLEKAKALLSATELKISSIMEETGYVNENIFYLAFKKYTGTTPGKFRALSKLKTRI